MNENELSEGLKSSASTVSARPDLSEVEFGAGRVRSRRRVATGVAAAMLVAGAGGTGFGIGRSLSGDGDGEIAASAAVSESVTATIQPAAESGERIDPPSPAPQPSSDSGSSSTSNAIDESSTGALDIPADALDGALGGYYEAQQMELVYERTLDNGVRVRAQRGQLWGYPADPESQWQPAPFCWGSAEMRITLDGAAIVDVTGGSFYEELFRDVWFEVTGAGWADGHEMRIVTVQAVPGITQATVRWSDGPTDTAPVVDGLAVLVVDGSSPWSESGLIEYAVDLTDADGSRTMTPADLEYHRDPEWRAACEEPPPELPPAGEQPADPLAAQAAIEQRFALLFDQNIDRAEKPDDLLDDWTGVDEALAAAEDGSYAETVGTAVHTIDELVFTSPSEAWFRYSIDTDVSLFANQYGTAALVGDGWQFPRALICQDIGLAGGTCEPWVDAIYPPSWYERYGEYGFEGECWVEEDGTEICAERPIPVGSVPPPPVVPVPVTVAPDG